MKSLRNIHPGEILKYEFLEVLKISENRLAKDINVPQSRISEIINKKRRISVDTSLRLAEYFGTSAQFWMGLQNDYDLEEKKSWIKSDLKKIRQVQTTLIDRSIFSIKEDKLSY